MCITYLSRDSCRNLICKNLGFGECVSLRRESHAGTTRVSLVGSRDQLQDRGEAGAGDRSRPAWCGNNLLSGIVDQL